MTTINVNKSINIKFDGCLEYRGTDFAITFTNFKHCFAEINRIRAEAGSCIKIYSNADENHIAYSRFAFGRLSAKTHAQKDPTVRGGYGIYFETSGIGYINICVIQGGVIRSGEYGVYVKNMPEHEAGFGGNTFEHVNMEGGLENIAEEGEPPVYKNALHTGFYFSNGCEDVMLYRCSLGETGDGFAKSIITEGENRGLKVIGCGPLSRSFMELSEETTGIAILSSILNSRSKFIDGYARFVRGEPISEVHDRVKDLARVDGVFDMSVVNLDENGNPDKTNDYLQYNHEYNEFLTGSKCTGITLSKKYGHIDGINEFAVVFQRDTIGSFPIKNYLGEEIVYSVPQIAGVTVRFKWTCVEKDEYGGSWKYSYEFSDVNKIRDFLVSGDDIVAAAPILKTVEGGAITDAAKGRAASVLTSFQRKSRSGGFVESHTLKLDVNGTVYTTDLPTGVYNGTYDWVTGELISDAYKEAAAEYIVNYTTGVSTADIKYIMLEPTEKLLTVVGSNRYAMSAYAVDKSIRVRSSGFYIYDNDIDFDNIEATVAGLELLFKTTPVAIAAHPKAIMLNAGENTVTTADGTVLEVTYGIDTKEYIDSQIKAYVDEAILGGAW